MKKPTSKQVVTLANLHRRLKDAEAEYEAAATQFRVAGAAVYVAGHDKVIVSDQQRAKVNWPKLVKKYRIPPREIERVTTFTEYTRIDLEYPC